MREWAKTLGVLLFGAAIIIITIMALLSLSGCQQAPVKADFKHDSCFLFADCLYRLDKAADKSICKEYASECRAYDRYLFCSKKDNRPDDMRFQECWDKLNSK